MLFHGSQALIEGALVPAGSYERAARDGAHPVVFATPSAGWALVFATAQNHLLREARRGSMHDAGDEIVIYHAADAPLLAERGFVYELPEAGFAPCGPLECTSVSPVLPEWRYRVFSAPFARLEDDARLVVDAKAAAGFVEALCTTRRTMQELYGRFGLEDRFADAFAIQEDLPCVGNMAEDLVHGYFHALRTSLLAQLIYLLERPDAHRTPAELAVAAALHDVGRFSEPTAEHGAAGARWVRGAVPLAHGADAEAVAALVERHSAPEDDPCQPFGLSALKDADAADRVRFLPASRRPKPEFLRLSQTARVIDGLDACADELYSREHGWQRAIMAARGIAAPGRARRLMDRPDLETVVGASILRSFKGPAGVLLGCGVDDALATWRRIAVRDGRSRLLIAVPLLGSATCGMRVQAPQWLVGARSLHADAVAAVRRLSNLAEGDRALSAELAWEAPLGQEYEGLSLVGVRGVEGLPVDRRTVEQVLGAALGPTRQGATVAAAIELMDLAPEGWLARGAFARMGGNDVHGSAAFRLAGNVPPGTAGLLDELLDALGAPRQHERISSCIARLCSFGADHELLLEPSAQPGRISEAVGVSLCLPPDADAAVLHGLLDALQELGLADGRAPLCKALAIRSAIRAVDDQGNGFETVMASRPHGVEVAWGADGSASQTTFLLEVIARTG